jgi:ABC-type branched-subunit amino acid transport system ATPase component
MSEAKTHFLHVKKNILAGQEAKSTSAKMRQNILKTTFPRYDEDRHGGAGICSGNQQL